MAKILFIGETWIKHIIHQKGFDTFTSTHYELGSKELFKALQINNDIIHIPSHCIEEKFPRSLEDLQKYDIIFISDIGSNSFLLTDGVFVRSEREENKCSMIKEYVLAGGNLVMIGGYLSFSGIEAKARYNKTAIQDVLPVQCLDIDDRVETPEGIYPEIVNSTNPVFDGIEGEWPMFFGYNKTIINEDATILAKFGDDPFLAVQSFGLGKSFVFTSDCAPHWGSQDFIDWAHYGDLWNNIVQFLMK